MKGSDLSRKGVRGAGGPSAESGDEVSGLAPTVELPVAVKDSEQTTLPEVRETEFQAPTDAEQLLSAFLAAAVPIPANSPEELRQALTDAAVSLLRETKPEDAIARLGGSLLVALNLAGLDCLARAVHCGDGSTAREVNLRSGIKIGAAVSDLIRTLDSRKGPARQEAVNRTPQYLFPRKSPAEDGAELLWP
jgi:hypothetical protein